MFGRGRGIGNPGTKSLTKQKTRVLKARVNSLLSARSSLSAKGKCKCSGGQTVPELTSAG